MNSQSSLVLSRLEFDPRHPTVRRMLGDPRRMYGWLLKAFDGGDLPHHRGDGIAKSGRADGGMLYRVEQSHSAFRGVRVLVQSTKAPDWNALESAGDVYLASPAVSEPFCIRVPAGTRLRFRLRAVPVRSRATGSSEDAADGDGVRKRGRRLPISAHIVSEFAPLLEQTGDPAEFRRLTALKNTRIEGATADWLARKLEPAAELCRVESESWLILDEQDDEGEAPYDLRIIREGPIRLGKRSEPYKPRRGDLDPVLFEGHLVVRDADALNDLVRRGVGPSKALGFGMLSLGRA